jgi:Zn-dependent M28 family amino/carboxypeptidase
VLLELARLLRAAAPRSDVVLAAVPFEEADIDGPHAPVAGAAALAARLCPARRVTGMVSIEMVGYATDAPDALGLGEGPADYVALVGDPRAADLIDSFVLASKEARGAARTLGAALDPSTTPDVYRSDHFAFAQLGVPAAMATDTANYRNPHYHQRTDLPDTIDYEFAAAVAASLLAGTLSYTARPR